MSNNKEFYKSLYNRLELPIPAELEVLPNSVPIPWFGDYENAKSCTISINPSTKEFLKSGKRIPFRKKENNDTLNKEDINNILASCNNYFSKQNSPYKKWFGTPATEENSATSLENVLNHFGYSYYDDNQYDKCVHLDIVQWATKKAWSRIGSNIKEKLLEDDLEFFKYLVNQKQFKTIFLNGRQTLDTFMHNMPVDYWKNPVLSKYNFKDKEDSTSVYFIQGKIGDANIIAWTAYLQTWNGNHNLIEKIKENFNKNGELHRD